MPGLSNFVFGQAFERNCPNVRLNKDEREELHRLFGVCAEHARAEGARDAATSLARAVELRS
jgi:hypothetical protein